MQYMFDEKIEKAIRDSLRSAVRLLKKDQKAAREGGHPEAPPSYEAFRILVESFMEANKAADLKELRTPALKELLQRAWTQKLQNYAAQKEFRKAYESL